MLTTLAAGWAQDGVIYMWAPEKRTCNTTVTLWSCHLLVLVVEEGREQAALGHRVCLAGLLQKPHLNGLVGSVVREVEKKCCLLESKWKIKYDLLRN